MQHQPARAFRNVAAQQDDAEPEGGADAERDPPAEIGRQPARAQKGDGAKRAQGGAEPKAAVDRKVGAPTKPRWHQLLDRRVDRRVLAADAGAGQQAKAAKLAKSQENAVAAVAVRYTPNVTKNNLRRPNRSVR